MSRQNFITRCIQDTLAGVRDGLTLFSGPSRVALIYAINKKDELAIFDPQNLLRGHEPKLTAIYKGESEWCSPIDTCTHNLYHQIKEQENPSIDGVISQGGSSFTVHYQMWFTDHHPNLCSLHPTQSWLRRAALRLSHDIANDSSLYTGISGQFLRQFGMHAIEEYLTKLAREKLQLDLSHQIYPILDSMLAVSKTYEEGERAHGVLAFVPPQELEKISFLTRFAGTRLPILANHKHVRKLLQAVENSTNVLVSDGLQILGVAEKPTDCFTLSAHFHGRRGFLYAEEDLVCSFFDGNFSSKTFRAKLFELEEALLDFNLSQEVRLEIFRIIVSLVHQAEEKGFGCSLVVDLAPKALDLAGQPLNPVLDLRIPHNLQLAAAFAKVDGALHIRADLQLHTFACLLDGFRVGEEDRSRGARYNSALRFTAQHPETIIIVVSSDSAVSVFHKGKALHKTTTEGRYSGCRINPQSLESWLREDCKVEEISDNNRFIGQT